MAAPRGVHTKRGPSNIDVIVVLRDVDAATLIAISNPLQLARTAARIESMILVQGEIPGAADTFPLLYGDVQRHHVLLAGTDPFAGLHVPVEHRRLRIEPELREAQIRLRRLLVDGAGNRPVLLSALGRKLKQLRPSLYALLTLRGHEPQVDGVEAVLQAAGRRFGIDVGPLLGRPHSKPLFSMPSPGFAPPPQSKE